SFRRWLRCIMAICSESHQLMPAQSGNCQASGSESDITKLTNTRPQKWQAASKFILFLAGIKHLYGTHHSYTINLAWIFSYPFHGALAGRIPGIVEKSRISFTG